MNVILLCHWSRTAEHIVRSLRVLGATIGVIHDAHSASIRYARSSKIVHSVPDMRSADPFEIVTVINKLHRKRHVDWVIGADFPSLIIISRMKKLSESRVYPMADLATLERLNDKWQFYILCQTLNVAVPYTMSVYTKAIGSQLLEGVVKFPLLIKPTDLYGGRGILHISSRQDLKEKFLTADYPYNNVIAQVHVPGYDWGMSVFARNGRILSWCTFFCPNFVSAIFRPNDELYEMGKQIISATGFTGIANFDARWDIGTESMKMLECNPRFFLRLTAARLCGLDFVKAGICADDGQKSLTRGSYYNWHAALSLTGIQALWRDHSDWRILARDLAETFRDPFPAALRKLWKEESTNDTGALAS